jgi:hypothetical protein
MSMALAILGGVVIGVVISILTERGEPHVH